MKNQPKAKGRSGTFQVSIWSTGGGDDSLSGHSRYRVCVQHSRYNRQTDTWENQSIWCSPEEIRNLREALDKVAALESEDTVESHGLPSPAAHLG